jgi:hypothetical protein
VEDSRSRPSSRTERSCSVALAWLRMAVAVRAVSRRRDPNPAGVAYSVRPPSAVRSWLFMRAIEPAAFLMTGACCSASSAAPRRSRRHRVTVPRRLDEAPTGPS